MPHASIVSTDRQEKLMTDDGYLSRNRPYLAAMQRQRRARMVRIDYMPGKAARDAIEAMRERTRPGTPSATNSAVIDAIVAEWARMTGIQQTEIDPPATSPMTPGVADQYARMRTTSDCGTCTPARMTSDNLAECAGGRARASSAGPEQLGASQARAGAKDFDPRHAKPTHPPAQTTPEFLTAFTRANESGFCHAKRAGAHANNSGSLPTGNKARVICGAKRRRDGQPCEGLSVPGKRRCKWHGGASTGPKTAHGRALALRNLRQYCRSEVPARLPTYDNL
ncbi:MAG: HGGxSTG domain-containing protein [Pseudomonadota bacterium]